MRHESWTIRFPKELVKCLFCCKCPGMAAALYRNGSQISFVSKCPGIGAALYRNGIISILFSTIQTFDYFFWNYVIVQDSRRIVQEWTVLLLLLVTLPPRETTLFSASKNHWPLHVSLCQELLTCTAR